MCVPVGLLLSVLPHKNAVPRLLSPLRTDAVKVAPSVRTLPLVYTPREPLLKVNVLSGAVAAPFLGLLRKGEASAISYVKSFLIFRLLSLKDISVA